MAGCFAQPLSDDMHFGSRPGHDGGTSGNLDVSTPGRGGVFDARPTADNTPSRQWPAGGYRDRGAFGGAGRPFASPFAADAFPSRSPRHALPCVCAVASGLTPRVRGEQTLSRPVWRAPGHEQRRQAAAQGDVSGAARLVWPRLVRA